MTGLHTKVKIKDYKCFKNSYEGFDVIKPINIVIGRNNSGKSSLLDILEFIISANDENKNQFNLLPSLDLKTSLLFQDVLYEELLREHFSHVIINRDYGHPWNNFGAHYVGKELSWKVDGNFNLISKPDSFEDFCKRNKKRVITSKHIKGSSERISEMLDDEKVPLFFKGKKIKRILADRDIVIEPFTNHRPKLNSSGENATSIIERFLNSVLWDRSFVTIGMLDALNEIFNPDANFTNIICRQYNNGNQDWEIFLEEEIKGYIALSGSHLNL